MDANPYAPPKSEVDDVGAGVSAPALWNPNAAAAWSLVFSPAFGAFLHMKNWKAWAIRHGPPRPGPGS